MAAFSPDERSEVFQMLVIAVIANSHCTPAEGVKTAVPGDDGAAVTDAFDQSQCREAMKG